MSPLSLVLYSMIFEPDPRRRILEQADRWRCDSRLSTDSMAELAAEIRAEIDRPTQRVRDILDCMAGEEDLRAFLGGLADALVRAVAAERTCLKGLPEEFRRAEPRPQIEDFKTPLVRVVDYRRRGQDAILTVASGWCDHEFPLIAGRLSQVLGADAARAGLICLSRCHPSMEIEAAWSILASGDGRLAALAFWSYEDSRRTLRARDEEMGRLLG
jgi:hypothetical protein